MQAISQAEQLSQSALAKLNPTDRAAVVKAVVSDAPASAVPVSRQTRQIQVLSKWAQAADVSKQLAQTEHTERNIRQAYQALENLRRQVNSSSHSKLSAEQQQQAQQKLVQLEKQLATGQAGISADLTLTGTAAAPFRATLSHNIDLLSERRQPEQVNILLGRSGNALQIDLPAGQSAEQNLHSVQQAFARQQIDVSVDNQQLLYFSAQARDARKLQEPWLVSGQGVRVAAGNPLNVTLKPVDTALGQLAKTAGGDNVQAYSQQIQQAQQKLKDALVKVQAQRVALQAQLTAIQQQQADNTELTGLAGQLRLQMHSGNKSSVAVVMSQANITRSLVEFGLG